MSAAPSDAMGAGSPSASAERDPSPLAPERDECYIEIRGLTKTFGSTMALRGLDLDIPEGQFLVLLGPSGCGKSTTMRSLVGLERPDSGSIRVDGRTLYDSTSAIDVPPNKRSMGMVFQSYALWPHKSVFKNVAFPLQMRRAPRGEIRAAVAGALETVGLAGFEKRSVTTLSGGQMQRVALARSLVMRPKILLLDEPLSNLDAKLRLHLRHELKEIQQTIGVTSIYVTHDQDEALGLADRIVVMREGAIAQEGAPEQIYRHPDTPFVADFLGMSNRYPVRVETSHDGRAVASLADSAMRLSCTDRRLDPSVPEGVACVRPESIKLAPDALSTDAGPQNSWPAEILSRQYQGSRLRYHAAIVDGPGVFIDASAESSRFEAGDRCRVSVDASDVLLLQETSTDREG